MKKAINWVALRLIGATPFKTPKQLVNPVVHTVEPPEKGNLFETILNFNKENNKIHQYALDKMEGKC